MKKLKYICKFCGDIFYHTDEAIKHTYGEHPRYSDGSPEDILDTFKRALPPTIKIRNRLTGRTPVSEIGNGGSNPSS